MWEGIQPEAWCAETLLARSSPLNTNMVDIKYKMMVQELSVFFWKPEQEMRSIYSHVPVSVYHWWQGDVMDWLEMTQNWVLYIKNSFFTSGWSERLRNSSEVPARALRAFCFSCFHSLSICSHCNFSVSSKHWKQ